MTYYVLGLPVKTAELVSQMLILIIASVQLVGLEETVKLSKRSAGEISMLTEETFGIPRVRDHTHHGATASGTLKSLVA